MKSYLMQGSFSFQIKKYLINVVAALNESGTYTAMDWMLLVNLQPKLPRHDTATLHKLITIP